MNWPGAKFWIDAMNQASYLGYNDWRLPTMIDVGDDGCNISWEGTDCGANVLTGDASTTVYSEMASMFYDTLGNLAAWDTSGALQQGAGLTNTGPFANLQAGYYWSGLEYAPNTNLAWFFSFDVGSQNGAVKYNIFYAWAVRSGDVSAVPLPPAVWLFAGGLVGLVGVARRKKSA